MSEGYILAFGNCWACQNTFAFDPDRVPSIVVDGKREPLCRHCVKRANKIRKAAGAPLIVVLPDAYGPEHG